MMKDWGGLWFQIRKEFGQSDMVTFQYLEPDSSTPVSLNFPHQNTDGFGALVQLLTSQNFQLMPPSKIFPVPSRWKLFYFFWRGLFLHPKSPALAWKFFDRTCLVENHEVAWLQLNRATESRLVQHAKELGINTTSLIFSALAEICREELCVSADTPGLWMLPVNMRGAFPEVSLQQICVSFIPIHTASLKGEWAAKDIYQQIRERLKTNWHWSFWQLYQIGRWIGYSGMKRLSARAAKKSFWTGTFSDLGSWENPRYEKTSLAERVWIIAPPGSPNYPIGATTMKWFGQRSIALKIHPSITAENPKIVAQRILDRLKPKVTF